MEEKKQKGSGFAWPSAAVVAALAATLAHNVSPLHSSRPDDKAGHEHTARGDQTVEARLWQDPFAAVAAYKKKQDEQASDSKYASHNKDTAHKKDSDQESPLHTVD